ncbi:MAG: 2,3-diaminopropionate biosynthesis protein SbnB [Legionellaceae bacterium]|nr:2,3-diaminopropionate biosynthesis protein SbnB [Legionellaceae bacterium]
MDDVVIINAELANDVLNQDKQHIINIVRDTYLNYHNRACINPDSFFLRFPDSDRNRIIGLAASNTIGDNKISGIKWIASYPDNLEHHLPRASASIILNDYNTGRAKAFIEGTAISAARTAASATLAATLLVTNKMIDHTLFLVGCGVISKTILDFIQVSDIKLSTVYLYDTKTDAANRLKQSIQEKHGLNVVVVSNLKDGIRQADLIAFATTEVKPYLSTDHIHLDELADKVILGISLRDICPDIVINLNNIVDDIDHCLKANTSVHLTEQQHKHRRFINGNISDLINGTVTLDASKPTLFSPFGMGVLDLNVAKYVYDSIQQDQLGLRCEFYL